MPSWARYDIWNIGIATLDRPLEDVGDLAPLANVRWLPPQPPLHLLADPFPYRHDGRDWLLAEAYGHPRGVRGRIVRLDPDDGMPAASASPAIVRAHHVSYPCTFTDGDRTFWHWESRFTTRPEDAERITRMVAEDIYQGGFDAIRRHLGEAA